MESSRILYLPGRASPLTSRKALESLRKMPVTKGSLFEWECQLVIQKGMGSRSSSMLQGNVFEPC